MSKTDTLNLRLDQIDRADPRQTNASLQVERQLIIMELMGTTQLNTTKLPTHRRS